jgi:ABC-type uncharacterized transport system permease subunit
MFEKLQKVIRHNFHPDNIAQTITELVAVIVWMVSTLVFYLVLSDSFPNEPIFQWNNSIAVIASYFVVDGLTYGILYRNFQSLAVNIEERLIDNFLLFPVDLKQFLTLRKLQFSSLIQVPIAIIAYLILGNFTLLEFALWIVTLVLGFFISYQLWFFLISLSFWFKSNNRLTNLFEEVSTIGMFPASVYLITKSIIFFYPFLLLSSLPAQAFITNQSLYMILTQSILILVLSLVNRLVLQLGVKTYRT